VDEPRPSGPRRSPDGLRPRSGAPPGRPRPPEDRPPRPELSTAAPEDPVLAPGRGLGPPRPAGVGPPSERGFDPPPVGAFPVPLERAFELPDRGLAPAPPDDFGPLAERDFPPALERGAAPLPLRAFGSDAERGDRWPVGGVEPDSERGFPAPAEPESELRPDEPDCCLEGRFPDSPRDPPVGGRLPLPGPDRPAPSERSGPRSPGFDPPDGPPGVTCPIRFPFDRVSVAADPD
jgi:translation initiation factor IF-2